MAFNTILENVIVEETNTNELNEELVSRLWADIAMEEDVKLNSSKEVEHEKSDNEDMVRTSTPPDNAMEQWLRRHQLRWTIKHMRNCSITELA